MKKKKLVAENRWQLSFEQWVHWNFKIINLSDSYEDSNYEQYIHCKKINNDFDLYCKRYNCDAVFLRPDKYIFDLINTEDESLDEIVSKILNQLKEKVIIS